MSLKGRLRIGVIFSVFQNTLGSFNGNFKNTFKWRGEKNFLCRRDLWFGVS